MEENIDKIFTVLEDKKNEPLFKIYITQLAEINKNNPRSSSIILERALKLTKSNVWECRLVAAGILEKVIDNHLYALQLFGANERITLELIDGLFVIEDLEAPVFPNSGQKTQQIADLKTLLKGDQFSRLDSIDYESLMNKETPLLSKDMETAYKTKAGEKKKEEKFEDEIFKKLELINEDKNVLSVLDFIDSIKTQKEEYEQLSEKSDRETAADFEFDDESRDQPILLEEEEYNENKMSVEEMRILPTKISQKKIAGKNGNAQKGGKEKTQVQEDVNDRRQDISKYETIQKKLKVSSAEWKKGHSEFVQIRSIFKLVYDFLSKSLFDPKWEIRNGACMALRNFIKKDIHRLYINLTISRKEMMAVDDQEDSMTSFIRNTVRGLHLSNAFFEDFLSRQLVIIALDRFMDHSSDRPQIIVRENSCQAISKVLALLFGEDPIIYDRLFDVISLFLKRKEWEIRIGALSLLKYVANLEEKTCPVIFQKFGEALLSMIDDNDDVLCVLSECFEIFVNKIPFAPNIEYFRVMNSELWKILESLDDISYSNSMVTAVLTSLHQKPDYLLLYPNEFSFQKEQENLLALFQHKIPLVRSSVYILQVSLLNISRPINFVNSRGYFENLLKLAIQNLMIESGKNHVENLLKLVEGLIVNLWAVDPNFCLGMLRYLIECSCSYEFKAVVQDFVFFTKTIFDPYSFVEISTDPTTNLFQIYERVLKTGVLLNGIINRHIETLPGITAIFEELIEVNHFALFCYLFVMVQTYTLYNNEDNFKSMMEKMPIDTILAWGNVTIKTPYLEMVEINIQRTLKSMTQILQVLLSHRGCLDTSRGIIQSISSFNLQDSDYLENLFQNFTNAIETYQRSPELQENERVNVVNCIQSIQFQISDYVTRRNELLNSLKTLCAGIKVINFTINKKPFEKLNAIIPPVVSNMLKPNFASLSKLTAFFLFLITRYYEGAQAGPIGKIFRNLFNEMFDEKVKTIAVSTTGKGDMAIELGSDEKNKLQENDYLVTGSRYDAFRELVKLLIQRNGKNFFKLYGMIFEALTNEFSKLQQVDFLNLRPEHTQSIDITEIYKTLKLHNVLRRIQKDILSVPESSTFVDHLFKAFALTNIFALRPNQDQQTKAFQEKCVKICLKLLRTYLNNYKELQCQAEIFSILERMYKLAKKNNLIVLKFLYVVHEANVEEFIDYTKIFIIQCIKKINHENSQIRKASVRAFASMINAIFITDTKIELENAPYLKKKYDKGFQFVFEFKNNRNFDFNFQTKVQTELRSYQMEGVKWLSFLVRYNMSAALCDDMGLGKTIQTLSVLQEEIYKQDQKGSSMFSLIIVPSSLTDHWHYEMQRFCDLNVIKPFVFRSAQSKSQTWNAEKVNVIIISYLMLSKHIDHFKDTKFNFMILDEAHLLKNPKAKIYKAVKEISAQHRVALTGTPIQNNIVELWSIFDVIMPGYLGDEDYFKAKYAKYFNTSLLKTAAKDMIISSEQDVILEELHRKVKPFILRRDKMSVLSELPPKVIQDYYCHMTEVQDRIYKEFDRSQVSSCDNNLKPNQLGGDEEKKKASTAVFQLLTSLRRICNHPYLFVKMANASHVLQNLKLNSESLETYEASGKLIALKALLNEMGFEDTSDGSHNISYTNNKNKILLFSRYKETLDVIHNQFIKKLFPSLNFLRIDGSIASSKRFEIVKKFNHDNNIKLLLLTTSVGGVGLNLHTANVVVMFDHDYNPMNDLQAIDRAHRIGQKNVLNVYRLIMKDTLEEQIMGIQRFKINVANSVINIDNSSIDNVKQSNLLSLFSTIKQDDKDREQGKKSNVTYDKYSKVLEGMEELWDEDQYNKTFV